MPKWTVMIFMGADTIEGNQPLEAAALADLKEIKSIDGAADLHVFVQLHRSNQVTRRYHFGDQSRQIRAERDLPGASPGDALIPFIRESILESDHREPDHSMLVLWGHAYDFAFGRSRTREGVIDSIDFIELSGKLRNLQDLMLEHYRTQDPKFGDLRPTLDIIGFDACDVATLELACQLQPFTKFLLGSQIGIPIPGWPYDRILDRIVHPQGRVMTPPEFGSYIVRRFCESYRAEDPVSLTLLNLEGLTDVRRSTKVLALALATAIGRSDSRDRIMDLFQRSQTAEGRPFVDAADLCLNLLREGGHPLVAAAAKALGNQLVSPRPPLVGDSDDSKTAARKRPLVAEFGRNAGELARLNGISLYAPHVAPESDLDAVRYLYDNFTLAQETRWSTLIHALADLS